MYEQSSLPTIINKTGQVCWQSPSNIAIVKYWGKYGNQLPRNPSISFTLSNAITTTDIAWEYGHKSLNIDFLFEGEKNNAFKIKLEKYLKTLFPIFPFLNHLSLNISSGNSFPHSSGIASSASAMSALALCLCSIEKEIYNIEIDDNLFFKKASYVARLGSGSACRSIYPNCAIWGSTSAAQESNNEEAIPWNNISDVFKSYHDDILIISKKEKEVSSRAGHALMDGNRYANERFKEANERLNQLLPILKEGNTAAFGKIAEAEAMSLHALMMMSDPPYMLFKGNTIHAIEKIKAFRNDTGLDVFYTLDAGPNIHLLYPNEIKPDVDTFVLKELKPLCEDGMILHDKVGNGPKKI
ncbi:MAG: diphosphomevalonate decarboxylase [Bacteroidota bacterium]